MDKLEKYLKDVESIANSLELLVKEIIECDESVTPEQAKQVVTAPVMQEVINQVATMPAVPVANGVQAPLPQMPATPVQPQPQMQVQAPVAQIPVAQQVESFTQEQIARAMANATQAGRGDLVQNIFATFKVQTLMEINPANYNQVATMLREAGIQI